MWKSYDFKHNPPEITGRDVTFIIRPGSPFLKIARQLRKENLIKDVEKFYGLALERNMVQKLKAGEFVLNTNMLPDEVLDKLSTIGVMYKVQVREGLTWWQAGKKVEDAGLGTFDSFKKAITDADLLAKYAIPAASAEGYLFPETYVMTRPESGDARIVVEAMLREFQKHIKEVWPEKKERPNPAELHKLITLASLVERETGDGAERGTIAGVFANRMRKGMLLQCDPTVIYGLGEKFNGNITKSNLRDKSNRYNTYVYRGLPPGPICSPGVESLRAAAFPAKHKFLYFVAKGNGQHYFSKNLREHNNAVIKYQLRRNKKTYRSTKSE